jgi:hypothetical protein
MIQSGRCSGFFFLAGRNASHSFGSKNCFMRIRELRLSTHLPEALAAFYGEVLELPVFTGNNELHIKAGSTDVYFETLYDGSQPFYHLAFNIPCNSIEAAKAWLSPRADLLWIEDYQSDVADFVNWNAQSVYFYDAAGNILELIARRDLHNDSSNSFNAASLLSVSEIGLVFPLAQYDQKVQQLMNSYSLPYFAKQPPLPQFKAVGDDEGLFIIVPEGRPWYPTQQASRISPLLVAFEHEGNFHRFEG